MYVFKKTGFRMPLMQFPVRMTNLPLVLLFVFKTFLEMRFGCVCVCVVKKKKRTEIKLGIFRIKETWANHQNVTSCSKFQFPCVVNIQILPEFKTGFFYSANACAMRSNIHLGWNILKLPFMLCMQVCTWNMCMLSAHCFLFILLFEIVVFCSYLCVPFSIKYGMQVHTAYNVSIQKAKCTIDVAYFEEATSNPVCIIIEQKMHWMYWSNQLNVQ